MILDDGLGVNVDHGKIPGYTIGNEVHFLMMLEEMRQRGSVDENLKRDIMEGIRSYDPGFVKRCNDSLSYMSASILS